MTSRDPLGSSERKLSPVSRSETDSSGHGTNSWWGRLSLVSLADFFSGHINEVYGSTMSEKLIGSAASCIPHAHSNSDTGKLGVKRHMELLASEQRRYLR